MSARTEGTRTRVAIDLPLPLDVASTLMQVIGAAYPDAMMDTRGGSQLVALIPDRARARKVTKKAAAAAREEASLDPALEGLDAADVTSVGPDGSMRVAPSEEVMRHLGDMMLRALESAGENYIEWTVLDPNSPARGAVLSACRSIEQTPHTLRQQAERALADARTELEQLRAEVAELRAQQ